MIEQDARRQVIMNEGLRETSLNRDICCSSELSNLSTAPTGHIVMSEARKSATREDLIELFVLEIVPKVLRWTMMSNIQT